jgi:hypothetical protein
MVVGDGDFQKFAVVVQRAHLGFDDVAALDGDQRVYGPL